MIRWFARNDIAANFLLIAILLWGIYSAMERVGLEVQPEREFGRVDVEVSYRGGTPAAVEKAVVIPIEKALMGLQGVENIESYAGGDGARILVYTKDHVDPKDLLDEVKARVGRINTFPQETDPPDIHVPDSKLWYDVIKIAVSGELEPAELRRAAERVRDDLIEMPEISQSLIQGTSPHEIAIEARPQDLRDYNLSFEDLTNAIRRSSVDLPAGRIQTDEGSLMIRSKGQAYDREDFENIVISNSEGAEVKLGTVATVKDGFDEESKIVRFNGRPALLVEALCLEDENALEIANAVKRYVDTAHERFPEGLHFDIWDDASVELEGRIGTLLTSLVQGCLLVLIVLSLFLRPSIALWVVIGIPVAFAGGFIMMPWFGITANVMSIFAFIIVVGIVVDDAIITGENVYTRMHEICDPLEAVTLGTKEVAVPVTFGALTTIVAFIPLMAFDGYYGSFTKQIPPVVAAALVFSLIESKLILPSHLKHTRINRGSMGRLARAQKFVADTLERFVRVAYEPFLRFCARHRYSALATFIAVALGFMGYVESGAMGFENMPSVDRNRIRAYVRMHRDTPTEITNERVQQVAAAVDQLRKEFVDPGTGESLIEHCMTAAGGWTGSPRHVSYMGFVTIGVTDPGLRSEPGPRNQEIAERWTELVSDIPDIQSLYISGEQGGGYRGDDDDLNSISIELRGPDTEAKQELALEFRRKLESYKGIATAWTSSGGTRNELQIRIKPEGEAMGLTQRELATQVRAAFFGQQAQRLQRDRDDVRVMVRMPKEMRNSLQSLEQLIIRTPGGGEAPFYTVADAEFAEARARIERNDGAQVITIGAEPESKTIDIVGIARKLAPQFDELANQHADLSWRYSGYVAEHEETRNKIIIGSIALFLALYALLAIPFRSLYQPIFVMLAVPFGAIGAMVGHLILDLTPSYLSVFGIMALAGVVVNDSLVMVSFINEKVRKGEPLLESVIHSGTRRFRPIIITSATTFAGLLPILFDRSLQAQFLIPMATSLAFGILFATAITLILIPTAYLVAEDIRKLIIRGWNWDYRETRNRQS
ncbi:MAG: efflux RND transporter permease subunit [Akkermansiaceae bacterium]|nr:efflux RND transporter permease subunit [Akkermansiaceae bacterium]